MICSANAAKSTRQRPTSSMRWGAASSATVPLAVRLGRLAVMPLPVTVQDFSSHLDSAKSLIAQAANETDPERQRNLALIAHAAAQVAHAEATWLRYLK